MKAYARLKVLNKIIRHAIEGPKYVCDFMEGFEAQWKALWSQKHENER